VQQNRHPPALPSSSRRSTNQPITPAVFVVHIPADNPLPSPLSAASLQPTSRPPTPSTVVTLTTASPALVFVVGYHCWTSTGLPASLQQSARLLYNNIKNIESTKGTSDQQAQVQ